MVYGSDFNYTILNFMDFKVNINLLTSNRNHKNNRVNYNYSPNNNDSTQQWKFHIYNNLHTNTQIS